MNSSDKWKSSLSAQREKSLLSPSLPQQVVNVVVSFLHICDWIM